MEAMRSSEPILATRHPEAMPRDARPHEVASSRLSGALDRLHSSVAHLEDRLQWVLDPSEQIRQEPERSTPTSAPLTELLHSNAALVEQAADRVARLLERIDLPS